MKYRDGWPLYPVNWPDYLFKAILNHYDAVYGANCLIATQLGRPLVWH